MKKMMVLLAYLVVTIPAFPYPREIPAGARHIFGTIVNMREKPDVSSKSVTQLVIGTRVTIESRSDRASTIDELTDSWYRVRAGNYSGYIWGALIADHVFTCDIDSDGTLELVLLKNLTEGVYSRKTTGSSRLELRIAGDGRLMASLGLSTGIRVAWGGILEVGEITISEIAWKKMPGFERPGNLLHINYHFSNEQGGNGEKIVAYYDGKLKEALNVIHVCGEGGYGCRSVLIYPGDRNGLKNRLIIQSSCRDYTDPRSKASETHTSLYTWDETSKSFLPVKTGD